MCFCSLRGRARPVNQRDLFIIGTDAVRSCSVVLNAACPTCRLLYILQCCRMSLSNAGLPAISPAAVQRRDSGAMASARRGSNSVASDALSGSFFPAKVQQQLPAQNVDAMVALSSLLGAHGAPLTSSELVGNVQQLLQSQLQYSALCSAGLEMLSLRNVESMIAHTSSSISKILGLKATVQIFLLSPLTGLLLNVTTPDGLKEFEQSWADYVVARDDDVDMSTGPLLAELLRYDNNAAVGGPDSNNSSSSLLGSNSSTSGPLHAPLLRGRSLQVSLGLESPGPSPVQHAKAVGSGPRRSLSQYKNVVVHDQSHDSPTNSVASPPLRKPHASSSLATLREVSSERSMIEASQASLSAAPSVESFNTAADDLARASSAGLPLSPVPSSSSLGPNDGAHAGVMVTPTQAVPNLRFSGSTAVGSSTSAGGGSTPGRPNTPSKAANERAVYHFSASSTSSDPGSGRPPSRSAAKLAPLVSRRSSSGASMSGAVGAGSVLSPGSGADSSSTMHADAILLASYSMAHQCMMNGARIVINSPPIGSGGGSVGSFIINGVAGGGLPSPASFQLPKLDGFTGGGSGGITSPPPQMPIPPTATSNDLTSMMSFLSGRLVETSSFNSTIGLPTDFASTNSLGSLMNSSTLNMSRQTSGGLSASNVDLILSGSSAGSAGTSASDPTAIVHTNSQNNVLLASPQPTRRASSTGDTAASSAAAASSSVLGPGWTTAALPPGTSAACIPVFALQPSSPTAAVAAACGTDSSDLTAHAGIDAGAVASSHPQQPIGAITVTVEASTPGYRQLTAVDTQCLQSVAALMSGTLERIEQMAFTVAAHRRSSGIIRMLKAVSHEVEVPAVIAKVVNVAYDLLQADRVSVFICDMEKRELVLAVSEDAAGLRLPMDKGIVGAAATKGEVLNIADAYDSPLFDRTFDEKTGYRTKSVLCMPIPSVDGQVVAVIQAINKRNGDVFTYEDIRTLSSVADTAGVTLHKAKLLQEANTARAANAALVEVVRLVNESGGEDVTTLTEALVDIAYRLVDADRIMLYLVDTLKNELFCLVSHEGDQDHGSRLLRIPMGSGLVGTCAATGKPINIRDAHTHPAFDTAADEATGYRTRSVLCMPVMLAGANSASTGQPARVVAVIQAVNRHGAAGFNEIDEELLSAFSSEVGVVIDSRSLDLAFGKAVADEVENEQNTGGAGGAGSGTARAGNKMMSLLGEYVKQDDAVTPGHGLIHAASRRFSGSTTTSYGRDRAGSVTASSRRHINHDDDIDGDDEELVSDGASATGGVDAVASPPIASAARAPHPPLIASEEPGDFPTLPVFTASNSMDAGVVDGNPSAPAISTHNSFRHPTSSTSAGTGATLMTPSAFSGIASPAAASAPSSSLQLSSKPGDLSAAAAVQAAAAVLASSSASSSGGSLIPGAVSLSSGKQLSPVAETNQEHEQDQDQPDGGGSRAGTGAMPSGGFSASVSGSASPAYPRYVAPSLVALGRDGSNGGSSKAVLILPGPVGAGSGGGGSVGSHTGSLSQSKGTAASSSRKSMRGRLPSSHQLHAAEGSSNTTGGVANRSFRLQGASNARMSPVLSPVHSNSAGGSLPPLGPGAVGFGSATPYHGGDALSPLHAPLWTVPPALPGRQAAYSNIRNWEFDVLQIDDNELCYIVVDMVQTFDLIRSFQLDVDKLFNFVHSVKSRYRPNPYHNFKHGVSVAHICFLAAYHTRLTASVLQPIELLALLLSALCHDVDHPGVNNAYETNAITDLAVTYNDQSVLEHHHAATMFELLRSTEKSVRTSQQSLRMRRGSRSAAVALGAVPATATSASSPSMIDKNANAAAVAGGTPGSSLGSPSGHSAAESASATSAASALLVVSEEVVSVLGLSRKDFMQFRKTAIAGILATDMTHHNTLTDTARRRAPNDNEIPSKMLVELLVHSADLSNPVLPDFSSVKKWADMVCDEFTNQVQKEKVEGLPFAPHMDGLNTPLAVAKLQRE